MADQAFTLTNEKLEELKLKFTRENPEGEESYVRISEDGMEAWLYLGEPLEKGRKYETEQLLSLLRDNGVMEGYVMPRIIAMAKKGVYSREIRVALGKKTVDGRDGYYEYFFSPDKIKKAPSIREDGSVDYSSMSMLQNVKKGDLLARYYPAASGEDGYTVDGAVFKARMARELPPLRGVSIIRKENEYFANVDGKVELKNNNIDIQTMHEVSGDVDMTVGRIEFFGDITINGNVGTGVVVRAGRNLVINGTIENATLFAGGDIILKRGIQGNMKAKIRARGNIYADFLEHCQVQADGEVQANYYLNSIVAAGQKVIATGKKGSIIGGYVHGLKGVKAKSLGNDVDVRTRIHAGYEREAYEKFVDCGRQETDIQQALTEVVENMTTLIKRRRLGGGGDIKRAMELQEWNAKKDEYFKKLDDLHEEKARLEKMIEEGKGARVIAEGDVHRGVIIEVEMGRLPIFEEDRYMFYGYLNGMVKGEHLRGGRPVALG